MLYIKFKLKEIRKSKGITQQKMADSINTKQQVISKYEKQEISPSLEKLVEIASVLNVTLDELVEFKKIHRQISQEIKDKVKK